MKLINIGFGNMVSAQRLLTVVSPDSAPVKRVVQEAKETGRLIDASYGHKTRAVLCQLSFEHIVVNLVVEQTDDSRSRIVETILDSHIVDERLSGIGIVVRRDFSADYDAHAVIPESLCKTERIVGVHLSVGSGVVFHSETDIHCLQGVAGNVVYLTLQETVHRIAHREVAVVSFGKIESGCKH